MILQKNKGTRLLCLAFAAFAPVARLSAATPTPAQLTFFENKIRPIFVENCYKCHSHEAEKLKGGLSVEYRDTLLSGGETGAAIVPGDVEKSLLIKAVRYTDPDLQMPPKNKKLSDAQIADLETWVKMGAPDPRIAATPVSTKAWAANAKDHWAFKAIKKFSPPQVKDTNWVASPIDAFILAKLEENGLQPSPPADKWTLIRRATFDLTGLPPSSEEVKEFLADDSTNAFAKVVDRLLASPQYGERWGRYWLDVARYSDTKGDVKKNQEAPEYPHAWTYRDYVIKAFNDDKPFNQFLLEQIAADKLPQDKNRSSLAALGFLTLGDHFNGNQNDIINDRIDVVTKGTMGLTVTCARCHDHKFDPIPTKDYYSLRGIFASSVEPPDEPILGTLKMDDDYKDFAKKYNVLLAKMSALDAARFAQRRSKKRDPQAIKELVRDETMVRRDIAQLEMTHPGSPPRAMVLLDSTKPKDSPVFIRGEADSKGEMVPRRFLEILSGPNRPNFQNGSGRLELARAIVNPYNPLTPRVAVNRIWMHHFGEGFVPTPDDFGNQSEPPSHPELLDFLAARFVQNGWSVKKLTREIMLSNVYQQSSQGNPQYAQIDPRNRLLWRANIHRLEFEALRDSILALGGDIDLTMGGHPIDLGEGGYSLRRTIYGYVDRRNLPEVYHQFDFANPDIASGKRFETTVPQQALFMMNSPLVIEQARNMVDEKSFRNLRDEESRIQFLYERIFQREPTEMETRLGKTFVNNSPAPEEIAPASRERMIREKNRRKQKSAMSLANISPDELKSLGSWEKYAHALLQSNEALYIN
ncbi:MAG: PSD1 and planctomycete cytochrome C domain-containing protein [Verrucomicrobiota bacterium]